MQRSLDNLLVRDLIRVPVVETVIRLTADRGKAAQLLRSFVVTSEVERHLDVLAGVLGRETGTGCFLRGDFGSGKSHFLAAIAGWLNQVPGSEAIDGGHAGFCGLRKSGRRLLPVELSLVEYRSTTPLEQILVTGIESRLRTAGVEVCLTPLSAFLDRLRGFLAAPALAAKFAEIAGCPAEDIEEWISARPRDAYAAAVPFFHAAGLAPPEQLVEDRHETLARAMAAVTAAGYDGVVLLLDELSEFFRSKSGGRWLNEDARTLQFLGEFASANPLWVIAAVQESIERTGDIAQATFRKIRDRFPVRLVLSTVHVRDLIARRLVVHLPDADRQLLAIHERFRRHFPSFTYPFDLFRDVYPIHPLTLSLLEGLSDLFSEHRGIVDFVYTQITGGETGAGILERPATDLLAPDSIYEHFAPRLAEFSNFNVFPRRIVPALDALIESELDAEDRQLARRLVRMLVLYHIHPTAQTPPVGRLAELAACTVAEGMGDVNSEFVAEAILEPLAERSPFIRRQTPAATPPAEAVFAVAVEADETQTLEPRLAKILEEVLPADTRPFLAALNLLDHFPGWPAGFPADSADCPVAWRGGQRHGRIHFCAAGDELECQAAIARELAAKSADFAVIATLWDASPMAPEETVAVWRLETPSAAATGTLRRWFAARLLGEELRPGNPAQAPLIEPVKELVAKLADEAGREALAVFFNGFFEQPRIGISPVALQLRRLDRIVEAAGEHLLDRRFPRAGEVAPRHGIQPSPRLYQRLLDEFCRAGSVSLQEARRTGLATLIDGLAAPLGLVEVKSAAYLFNPDPLSHPLLLHLHGLLSPAGRKDCGELLAELAGPPFGLPRDTAEFAVLALSVAGLVSPWGSGRTYPVDFLRMGTLSQIEAVAMGELISQGERELLMSELTMLAPPGGWTAFGLKQQRQAWATLCKLRERCLPMVENVRASLQRLAGYSALEAFEDSRLREALAAVEEACREIKVSYSAREGLERFLRIWQARKLSAETFDLVRNLDRFLQRGVDQLVFVSHYLDHPVVTAAREDDEELKRLGDAVLSLINSPVDLLCGDDPERVVGGLFGEFREAYARLYATRHAAFHRPVVKPKLSRQSRRAVDALQQLAGIAAFDRPEPLTRLLQILNPAEKTVCTRRVEEILQRAPVCDCGYGLESRAAAAEPEDPDALIDTSLAVYARALRSPQVLEAIRARCFALRDAEPAAAARLEALVRFGEAGTANPGALLVDLVDSAAAAQISQALAGRVRIVRRELSALGRELAGRQLKPVQMRQVFESWLGDVDSATLVGIEEAGAAESADCTWWQARAARRFPQLGLASAPLPPVAADRLAQAFPAGSFAQRMDSWSVGQMVDFICHEPFHLDAVRQAWNGLLRQVLQNPRSALAAPADNELVDPPTAAALANRLARLLNLHQTISKTGFSAPPCLCARLDVAALFEDEWCNAQNRQLLAELLARLAAAGDEWLASLPPRTPLATDSATTVLVIDGAPPDVWMRTLDALPEAIFGDAAVSWRRLETKPVTGDAVAAIFGLSADAADALPANGILYEHLSGFEAQDIADLVPDGSAGPAVVRIALLDSGAHAGNIRLQDMPSRLADYLRRQIAAYRHHCLLAGRDFMLTTDHGVTWDKGRLHHGGGGVYERAIFQASWHA